jgi:exopolysaccharide production protein ExoQ
VEADKPLELSTSRGWKLFPTTLVAILVLYTTLSRLLNWDILLRSRTYRSILLLDQIGLSYFKFPLEIVSLNSIIILITISCALVLLLTQWRYIHTRTFWLAALPILALLAITGLSRYWSVAPGFTDSRFSLLLAGALGGVLIGLAFQTRELKTLLEVFAAVLVIGSYLMIILKPEYGVTYDLRSSLPTTRWIGLFSWKMPAGMMMGFATIIFFFRLMDYRTDPWAGRLFSIFFFSLSFIALHKSSSLAEEISGVVVLMMVIFGALFLKWGYYLKPVHWGLLGGLTILFLLLVVYERGFFFSLVGRDESLTGRLPLWISLLPAIRERLFFGYGFGEAFWKNSNYYQSIWNLFPSFLPVFAHNGYIEALLDNGVVGLLLWIIFLVQVAYTSLRYFFRERKLSTLFFFSCFIYMVVMNIANNHLGSYETFTWLMLVISFAAMVRENLNKKNHSST